MHEGLRAARKISYRFAFVSDDVAAQAIVDIKLAEILNTNIGMHEGLPPVLVELANEISQMIPS